MKPWTWWSPNVRTDTAQVPAEIPFPGVEYSHLVGGMGLCWCGPSVHCAFCDAQAPCIHGPLRPTYARHSRAS